MIEKITLRNFQRHRKLSLDLSPGVNTIVGPTDVGKSAILRALRWAVLNDPAGEAFRRSGSSQTSVEVVIDGRVIRRAKSPHLNQYFLDEKEYTAFGGGVPGPIAELANVEILNFQSQHDSPFWFADTAGEVSRQLNRIINLSIIDQTLSNIASTLRSARAERDVTAIRYQKAKAERERLRPVKDLADRFRDLEEREREAADKGRKVGTLQSILRGVGEARERAGRGLKLAERMDVVVSRGEAVEGLRGKRDRLKTVLQRIRELSCAAARTVPDLRGMEGAYHAIQSIKAKKGELFATVKQIKVLKVEWDRLVAVAKEAGERLETEKEKGDVCPTCGKKC